LDYLCDIYDLTDYAAHQQLWSEVKALSEDEGETCAERGRATPFWAVCPAVSSDSDDDKPVLIGFGWAHNTADNTG